MDEFSMERAVSTITGLITARLNQVRDAAAVARCPTGVERDDAAADGRIATSAIAATACDLCGRLVDLDLIQLICVRAATVAGYRYVDRVVDHDGSVQQRAEEGAIAA